MRLNSPHFEAKFTSFFFVKSIRLYMVSAHGISHVIIFFLLIDGAKIAKRGQSENRVGSKMKIVFNVIYKLPRRLTATPLQNLKGIVGRSHDFGMGEKFWLDHTKSMLLSYSEVI